MTSTGQDFTIYQGTDKNVDITIQDENGAAVDLTGVAALVWRAARFSESAKHLLEKVLGNSPSELDVTDAAAGQIRVFLDPDDTNALLTGTYHHWVVLTDTNAAISTVTVGTMTVEPSGPTDSGASVSLVTVEDGTGVATANAYITLADADSYHEARGNSTWMAAKDEDREYAIVKGADYMTQRYRRRWKGIRTNATQALDWPRAGVLTEDFFEPESEPRPALFPGLTYVVDENSVPKEIKNANAELALRALSDDLNPDLERGGQVKRLKAGPAEIEYFDGASATTLHKAVDQIVAPFLRAPFGQRQLARG